MAKRRKLKKGAMALLILLLSLTIFVTILLVNFITKQVGLARVKLSFVERLTIIEVNTEVDLAAMVATASGELSYPNFKAEMLGEFVLDFKVTNEDGFSKNFKHNVKVVDTTAPIINLKTRLVATKEIPDYDNIVDGKAWDNYEGNLVIESSGKVEDKPGIYEITYFATDSSGNRGEAKAYYFYQVTPENMSQPFSVDEIVIVNNKIPLPRSYNPGRDSKADTMLANLKKEAARHGHQIKEISVFRSFTEQDKLYHSSLENGLTSKTENYIAPAGYSEHQTGLAYDLSDDSSNFANSNAYKWLVANCAEYGFILRYPKGKEKITGYKYEPWHFRYVGVIAARVIMENDLTLEEYLHLD